jgi:hypothetical protein
LEEHFLLSCAEEFPGEKKEAVNIGECIFNVIFSLNRIKREKVRVIVFNATFNNISVISWWSVLLVE